MRLIAYKSRAFLPLFAGVFLSDCASKRVAVEQLSPAYVPHEILGDLLRFTLAYNQRASMGLSAGAATRWIVAGAAILMLLGTAIWLLRTHRRDPALYSGSALVAAGAMGNLVDRIRWDRGVVDFIDIGIGQTRFWIFNIADVAVFCGAIVLWLATRHMTSATRDGARDGDDGATGPAMVS